MIQVVNELKLSRFFEPVSEELELVETEFNNLIQSLGINHTRSITDDVAGVQYKFLRAGMILLAAKAVGKDASKTADAQMISLASVMELIFHAVFIHNHIGENNRSFADGTDLESKIAVLVGDSLYTRAFYEATQILPANMFRTISDLTLKMCLAEIKEETLSDTTISQEDYLELIREKTAVFFGICCKLSASLVSAGEAEARQLEKFGLNLGMLYQISLDFPNDQLCSSFAINAESAVNKLKESIFKNKLIELLNYFTADLKLIN